MNNDLKLIKKLYGEKMMHLCREYFPTILATPTLLPRLLQEHFYPTHDLYNDLISNHKQNSFKNYIYSLIFADNRPKNTVSETPEELLAKAGYDLYECHTEEEVQSFKKYYYPGEELCTFNGGRLDRCRVFFAVKKDVANIKREDFSNPLRQDLYGTSVISIQFSKDGTNSLSIKNRYNHTVADPDATFSNDLDNIIAGLTDSFEKYYGIVQTFKSTNFEIPNYVIVNGKYYKYNYEINNYYYCPNNIIINDQGTAREYNHEKYIVMDYFLLDLVNKHLFITDPNLTEDDFPNTFVNITKIDIKNNGATKDIYLTNAEKETMQITLDKQNRIISIINNYCKNIGNNYLYFNKTLKNIEMPNLESIGYNFNLHNNNLETLKLPKVTEVGHSFLLQNTKLQSLSMSNLQKAGGEFLQVNGNISSLNLPSLEEVGPYFLFNNSRLRTLTLPNLRKAGKGFMCLNSSLEYFEAPNLLEHETEFLALNPQVKLNIPGSIKR